MKRIVCLILALLLVLSLCACGDGGSGGRETLPTEFEEVPGMSQRLPDAICGSWHLGDGRAVNIYPDAVATPDGYFTDYIFHEDSMVIELLQDGQVVCTVCIVDERTVMTVDIEGNEMLFYSLDDTGGDDWQEPLDEAERLNMAYNKVLEDFNAAISGQPVYDEEGNEISDGPTLAEYLYNQFLDLEDYEDAVIYLSFFKTREEPVTTVCRYSPINGMESTYDEDLPQYDVLGRVGISDTTGAQSVGFIYEYSGNQRYQSLFDENNALTQVIITTTNGFGDVINTCVADLEYNGLGQHIATHVAFVDENGNDVRYTSTLEYDDCGNLIRIDIPYCTSNDDTGTYTALYAYDDQGGLLRDTTVMLPDDLDWYEQNLKRPFSRTTSKKIYDENGLLIAKYTCSHAPDSPGYSMTTYTYDEQGLLVNKVIYGYDYGWSDWYNSGVYSTQEISDIQSEMVRDIFGLPDSYDDRTPESWVNNEDFDLAEWDWIPHTLELNSEYTYTYDKTETIMYIDLTPED